MTNFNEQEDGEPFVEHPDNDEPVNDAKPIFAEKPQPKRPHFDEKDDSEPQPYLRRNTQDIVACTIYSRAGP
jgi:hypothetical protein